MTERVEQRYCIKFCQKLGDSKAETVRKIQQAFGDDAMGVTQIKEWFNRFKDGRTLADSDQRSGRPSTSRNANVIENVRSLILEDRRLTVREIADEVGISTGSAVRRKRPDLWASHNWQLHHNNAPAHSPHLIQGFLAKTRHSSCSPGSLLSRLGSL
jgi:transposase